MKLILLSNLLNPENIFLLVKKYLKIISHKTLSNKLKEIVNSARQYF